MFKSVHTQTEEYRSLPDNAKANFIFEIFYKYEKLNYIFVNALIPKAILNVFTMGAYTRMGKTYWSLNLKLL
jgi:hypothetical protein